MNSPTIIQVLERRPEEADRSGVAFPSLKQAELLSLSS